MKLGMMLEVDEIFTTIWLSRSSEVRVRRWPQSPIGTVFKFQNGSASLVPPYPGCPGKEAVKWV